MLGMNLLELSEGSSQRTPFVFNRLHDRTSEVSIYLYYI